MNLSNSHRRAKELTRRAAAIIIMVASLSAFSFRMSAAIHYELTVSPEDVRIIDRVIDGQIMTEVYLDQGADFRNIGETGLPVIPLCFSVPVNAQDFKVSFSCGSSSALTLSHPLAPRQPAETTDGRRIANDTDLSSDYEKNRVISYSNPAVWYDGEESLAFGFLKQIYVYAMPFSYDAETGNLEYCGNISVDVSWTNGPMPANLRIPKFQEQLASKVKFMKDVVDNPQDVEGNVPSQALRIKAAAPGTENYRHIVVTSRELAPAFERLCALRRLKGYTSKIFCMEDILADERFAAGDTISGLNDDAGKLRAFLQYAYTNYSTEYVLLGGNWSIIPIRYYQFQTDTLPSDSSHLQYDINIASDLYYSKPFDNWEFVSTTLSHDIGKNPDGSFIYCRHPGKVARQFSDFKCDLHIGRIPCRRYGEAEAYIAKLESYEFNPGDGDPSYLNNAFVAVSSDMSDTYSYLQSKYKSIYADNLFEINQTKSDIPKSGTEIVASINSGQWGYVDFEGHGNPEGIIISEGQNGIRGGGLHALDRESLWMSNQEENGLDCIKNENHYNWSLSMSCTLGPLQSLAPYDGLKTLTYNFAESYILGNNYGGIAFYANSGPGIMGASQNLSKYFFDTITEQTNANDQFIEVGRIGSLTKKIYNKNVIRNLMYKWNLFGDPTINLWMREPGRIHYADHKIDTGCVDTETMVNLSCMDITDNNVIHNTVTRLQTIGNLTIPTNRICTVASKDLIPEILPATVNGAVFNKQQTIICADIDFGKDDAYTNTPVVTFTDGANVEIHSTGNVSFINNTEMQNGSRLTIHSPQPVSIKNLVLLRGADLTIYAPGVEMKSGVDFRQGSSFNFIKTSK